MKPLTLSVAVPCYNGAAYLAATLESLLAQTRPADEILVVDDGSNDGSGEIAATYPVRLLIHQENGGLAAARNTALEAATGDVILYVDVDAQADAALLETILGGFSGADVVGVGGRGIEANIQTTADRWRALHASQSHGRRPLAHCEHLFGLCMAYRRAALLEIGGFAAQFRTNAEDMDVGFRLRARGGQLRYEPAAMVFHQRQDGEESLLRAMRAWYYWAYIAKAASRQRPWTLWAGTLRRAVGDPLSDLWERGDVRLARLSLKATAVKLAALNAAALDWRADEPGRAWRKDRQGTTRT